MRKIRELAAGSSVSRLSISIVPAVTGKLFARAFRSNLTLSALTLNGSDSAKLSSRTPEISALEPKSHRLTQKDDRVEGRIHDAEGG